MGRRHAGLVVDMCEDLEAELRILIEDLEAARHLFAATLLHEALVRKQALQARAHFLTPGRPRIALEDRAAVGHELIEIISHVGTSLRGIAALPESFAHLARDRQSRSTPRIASARAQARRAHHPARVHPRRPSPTLTARAAVPRRRRARTAVEARRRACRISP